MNETRKKFIIEFWAKCNEICPKYNLRAIDAIVAQACNESRYGESSLASTYHNYWGMKCGSSYNGKSVNLATKEEYQAGVLTDIRANFRAYDSMEDGIKGYCEFITGFSRYSNLLGVADNHQYIVNIKNDGWATDSRYIDTLDSIVPVVRETINEFGVWLASQAQSPSQNQSQSQPQTQGRTYRVVAGDTLSQIAKRFGVPMSQLVELNHIQNPNMIRVGQVLTIDRVGAPTYVVQKGDNLTKIALAHHTTVERLVQLNHISNPNLIRVGQKLLV